MIATVLVLVLIAGQSFGQIPIGGGAANRYLSMSDSEVKSRSGGKVVVLGIQLFQFDPELVNGQLLYRVHASNVSAGILLSHPLPASTQVTQCEAVAGEANSSNGIDLKEILAACNASANAAMSGDGSAGEGVSESLGQYDLYSEPVQGATGSTRYIYQRLSVHVGCRSNLETDGQATAKVQGYCGNLTAAMRKETFPIFGTVYVGHYFGQYYKEGQRVDYDSSEAVVVLGIRNYSVPAARTKLSTDSFSCTFKNKLSLDKFNSAHVFGSSSGSIGTSTNSIENGAGPVSGGGGGGGGPIGD
jgi:hypothetical protein